MKVLCINNKNPENPQKISLSEYVFEGEIYTVVEAQLQVPTVWVEPGIPG